MARWNANHSSLLSFVGVFDGTANTVVLESSANGYGGKIGMVVAINMAEETLRGVAVTTHTETPGLGANAKSDPAFAAQFADKQHALFLGRGMMYPLALEGALKLKEISYIHAEGYPAGELKHGPLALVDANVPIVAVAPNDKLLDKLKSNLQEVRARGGRLYVFAEQHTEVKSGQGVTVLEIAPVDIAISPIIFSVPLQLLAYHVALLKGTDVDQPRNLAKSVTVE